MPPPDVVLDASQVVLLLEDQWPGWRGQEVVFFASGWDNFMFRVGQDHLARFPRRRVAVELLANEARWLPGLAPHLPLPIPASVLVGEPGHDYPWPWSLVPWIDGESAATASRVDLETCARQLAEFLTALHQPAPEDAPRNPYRGTPLIDRDAATRQRVADLEGLIDGQRVLGLWEESLSAPVHRGQKLWLHGDLHPLNLLVSEGVLAGVVDFGDVTAGDPATDLAVMWSFLPVGSHPVFQKTYRADDVTLWLRARGWAVSLGLTYLASSGDNPVMGNIGRRMLEILTSDELR